MVTPPTLIVTLFQSRLYVFYNVLILTFVIAILLLLRGVGVVGVAVALLQPLWMLGEGVEGVD
jgi:hypothetical protein